MHRYPLRQSTQNARDCSLFANMIGMNAGKGMTVEWVPKAIRDMRLLAALDADDGSRIPHDVALAIMRGGNPVAEFRNHLGITLRDLSARTGVAASYLSEIERGAQVRLRSNAVSDRQCAWDDDRHLGGRALIYCDVNEG